MQEYRNLTLDILLQDEKNVLLLIAGIFIILATIASNLFIILTVLLDKTMRNYTNIQFASMSCADTIVGSIAMPFMLINTLYGYWPLSDSMCILFIIGDFVGGNISMLMLTIVAFHRLRCIRKPFGMKKDSKVNSIVPSLIVWPTILIFWTVPSIFIVNNYKSQNAYMDLKDCYYMFEFEYVILVDLVAYLIPIFMLIYFQVSIYFTLKSKEKFINPIHHSSVTSNYQSSRFIRPTDSAYSTESFPGVTIESSKPKVSHLKLNSKFFKRSNTLNYFERRKSSMEVVNTQIREGFALNLKEDSKQPKNYEKIVKNLKKKSNIAKQNQQQILINNSIAKNKKAFRTLFFVTCSLIIFWFPWMVSWPVDAYCDCIPKNIYAITYWLEYLNSLINSIILIIGNQHFRRKFLLLFGKNTNLNKK